MDDESLKSLSDWEVALQIQGGLKSLEAMCVADDAGATTLALNMSTEIARILTSNNVAVRIRGNLGFQTIEGLNDRHNLLSEFKLVAMRIFANPPRVTFVPILQPPSEQVRSLTFRDWWNRDAIFRASAAAPGSKPGVLPVRVENQVPFEKRRTLVRRQIVEMVRNKLGAHLDVELPQILDDLQRLDLFAIAASVNTEQGKLSTLDGTLPLEIGPLSAILRRIAQEVLEAFASWSPTREDIFRVAPVASE